MSGREQPSTQARQAERRGPTVLQVLPALEAGGAERGTVEIATALRAAGWRALVASAGGPMAYELGRTGAEHAVLPLDRASLVAINRNTERLTRLIKKRGVDLVHARARAPAWSAYTAARRTGRPFVTTFHGIYGEAPWTHWYNAILAKGDMVIAASDVVAEHVRRHYRIQPHRLVTIPRGIDTELFDPANVGGQRIVQLANAWRLSDGINVVMLPGRFTEFRDHKLLMRALARLGRDDVIVVLLGVDTESERDEYRIERLVERRRLAGQVRIVDACRDMAAAYMLADVVVAPVHRPPGFDRTIAEAQAMGRPVIAPGRGAGAELIRHGETGWLVRPGRADELAAAIDLALSLGHQARHRLAMAARAEVEQRYSLARMQAQTLGVYRDLLERWR